MTSQPFASQEGFLFGRFHAFGHHVKAQAVGHSDHGVDQLGIAVVAGQDRARSCGQS